MSESLLVPVIPNEIPACAHRRQLNFDNSARTPCCALISVFFLSQNLFHPFGVWDTRFFRYYNNSIPSGLIAFNSEGVELL